MAKVEVSRRIDASPADVWAVLADLAGHVSWMEDARAITFTTAIRSGAGTEFDCDTVIGPIRLVDHMRITEWDPERLMAIRHVKPVTGTGRITLEPAGEAIGAEAHSEAAGESGSDDARTDASVDEFAEPPQSQGATIVTWSEELTMPWWLGGGAGGVVAAQILHRVWGRSLVNLERLVRDRQE